jgi:prophage tail gpP-like protein
MQSDCVLFIYKNGFGSKPLHITQFESFSVDSDLFLAADSCSFSFYDTAADVRQGMLFRLYINGVVEATGIIDSIHPGYDKNGGRTFSISGRDMAGLLCDSSCEKSGHVLAGKTIREAAAYLITKTPYVKKEDFVFAEGAAQWDKAYSYAKIEVGEKIFEVLTRLAKGRGLIFYCNPDGTFVFDKPKPAKTGSAQFYIITKRVSNTANNAESGSLNIDISQAYTQVTIISQIQGDDDDTAVTLSGMAKMPAGLFPAGFYKPLVKQQNADGTTPKRLAAMEIMKMQAAAFSLDYTVEGHVQNGRNWTINEYCNVQDIDLTYNGAPINNNYLIYGRTFTQDKQAGSTTKLKLGLPGVILE